MFKRYLSLLTAFLAAFAPTAQGTRPNSVALHFPNE